MLFSKCQCLSVLQPSERSCGHTRTNALQVDVRDVSAEAQADPRAGFLGEAVEDAGEDIGPSERALNRRVLSYPHLDRARRTGAIQLLMDGTMIRRLSLR